MTQFTLSDYEAALNGQGALAGTPPERLVHELCTMLRNLMPDPAVNQIPVLSTEEVIVHNELVEMRPMNRRPLTSERLERTYQEGGPALAPYQRVYAVGIQASDALYALGDKIGWGALANFRFEEPSPGAWYATFTAGGTSMKAGGRFVPGGCLVDWWK